MNTTNSPAESAMQPVWAKLNKQGKWLTFYGATADENVANMWRDDLKNHKAGFVSELMERAEHDRQMAALREELTEAQAESMANDDAGRTAVAVAMKLIEERDALREENARLRKVLQEFALQKKKSEMPEEDSQYADYAFAYHEILKLSREALSQTEED